MCLLRTTRTKACVCVCQIVHNYSRVCQFFSDVKPWLTLLKKNGITFASTPQLKSYDGHQATQMCRNYWSRLIWGQPSPSLPYISGRLCEVECPSFFMKLRLSSQRSSYRIYTEGRSPLLSLVLPFPYATLLLPNCHWRPRLYFAGLSQTVLVHFEVHLVLLL